MLGLLQGLNNGLDCLLLSRLINFRLRVNRRIQQLSINMLLRKVKRQENIYRPRLEEALPNDPINLCRCSLDIPQLSRRVPQALRSLIVELMIWLVPNRMMDHHVILLYRPGGLTNNMDELDLLGHGARNAIQSTELTNTMGGYDTSRDALDACVAVGGV